MDSSVLTEMCLQQLTLSGVHEGEKVVVLSQGSDRLDYADAFLAAGQRLGARMYHMRLPAPLPSSAAWTVGETGLAANPDAVEALKQADMVVDLIFLLFSDEQMAIQAAGARVLTAVEPAPLLARLMPTKQLRERVETAAEILRKAKTMRITSKHGTDVTYKIGVYPTIDEYGYTDKPGRWDHWPAAFVFTGGADDGVDGKIVLAPGDVLLPFNTYVREPVTYTIEKGFIQDIRGGLDAELIKLVHGRIWGPPRLRHVARRLGARSPRALARADAVPGRHGDGAPLATMATSCSRRDPITSSAARTTPPAISTSRCAIAVSSSMTSPSCWMGMLPSKS